MTPVRILYLFTKDFKLMKVVYDTVGSVPSQGVTLANVLKPLIDLDEEVQYRVGALTVSNIRLWSSSLNIVIFK